ncbi:MULTISPECIES: helix-turn-helix transcriptional regulator [unclassified Paludibacterium]|uniref:AraC family transcriptional regulator n=1 Tax=unclassified Paludibacterium TaxID=2618429 RepID=UPI001C05E082|nr:helix-turn-helix transcriptional regulator [Paludibacterium sp. B53371]BEV71399.1 helix-turn-helix transcriptional regulator [Paludibacterium sp. THUN1379]
MNQNDLIELSLPALVTLPRPVLMRIEHRPGHSYVRPHRHPWAQFMYCSSGVMSVTTEIGSYVMTPDMGLWIPPNIEHSVEMVQAIEQESLYLDGELGARLAGQGGVVHMNALVRELIHEAGTYPVEYDEQGEQGRLIAVLIDQLSRLSLRDVLLPFPRDGRLQSICRQLIAQPACDHSLEDWAGQAAASSRTLSRLFESETGMGFRAWRQRLRLQRAMLRLGEGAAVSRVAAEVGYTSASAFIVAFKRFFGFPPGSVGNRHETTNPR